MRGKSLKITAGLAVLAIFLMLLGAAWRNHTNPRMSSQPEVDKLVADLRWERPWFYRWIKQTHTLAAARGLWQLRAPADEVLPTLRALLSHKLTAIRIGALKGISEMGHEARQSRPEVEPLISDENEGVRRAAAETLRRL